MLPFIPPPVPKWKRRLDVAGCLCAFPLLTLVTLVLAAVMPLLSPGPIFYQQERVGRHGRRFRLFKFRTMHVAADERAHQRHLDRLIHSQTPMLKLDARLDARLIPGGWLMRATGLDELPQVINVWRGEMSLVGPRPCIPYEYESFSSEDRRRCATLPGLTGLWQVSGKNRTTFEEMIALDRDYCERCSLGLDLRIIVLTVPALCIQILDTARLRSGPRVPAVASHSPRSLDQIRFHFNR